jgi:biopolymer transport protein ExbD
MLLKPRGAEEKADLNVTPLIDVMMVLLIFFMLTAKFSEETQVDVERPGAASGTAPKAQALRVVIEQSGGLWVDDVPVKPWALQARVRDLLRDAGDPTVLVVTDRRVPAEKLIEVVDQCRLAGASDVGVITDAEGG